MTLSPFIFVSLRRVFKQTADDDFQGIETPADNLTLTLFSAKQNGAPSHVTDFAIAINIASFTSSRRPLHSSGLFLKEKVEA